MNHRCRGHAMTRATIIQVIVKVVLYFCPRFGARVINTVLRATATMPVRKAMEEISSVGIPTWFAARLVEVAHNGLRSEAEQQEFSQDMLRAGNEMRSAEARA